MPFRAVLVKVSTIADDISISGTAYLPMENAGGKTTVIELMGMPGTEKKVNIQSAVKKYRTAIIDGKRYSIDKAKEVGISKNSFFYLTSPLIPPERAGQSIQKKEKVSF